MRATTEKKTMMITFNGDSHQIDANTLISVLSHYNSIINIANQEFGGGNRDVRLSVVALKQGSFDIVLSLDEGLKTLFSKDTIEYLAALSAVVGGIFAVYKKFCGKPVNTEKDLTIVKNVINGANNTVTNIVNIYNIPATREAVSKSFERANDDSNVDGLTIDIEGCPKTAFHKEDFPSLIYKDFDKENLPKEKSVFVDAYLTITALNFMSGGNWRFLYNGFTISMMVKDDALMQVIDGGARFGKGDTLHVKLKINQRYDEQMRGFVNISYRIEEFYEHIPVPKQGTLFER